MGWGATGLAGAADEVRAAGGVALPIEVDLADPQQVEAAAARAEVEFGEIDTWVNVAMSSVFAPFTQVAPEEFKRVTEVTYSAMSTPPARHWTGCCPATAARSFRSAPHWATAASRCKAPTAPPSTGRTAA